MKFSIPDYADLLLTMSVNPFLNTDTKLYLAQTAGFGISVAHYALFRPNHYADILAYEAGRQLETEISCWLKEKRRDEDGVYIPFPLKQSIAARKMTRAREFQAAALDADQSLLELRYHPHDQSHWVVYTYEPDEPLHEQVRFKRGGNIRCAVREACNRLVATICARNRAAFAAIARDDIK